MSTVSYVMAGVDMLHAPTDGGQASLAARPGSDSLAFKGNLPYRTTYHTYLTQRTLQAPARTPPA